MLAQTYLKSIIHYNPDTGIFTRTDNPSNRNWVGYKLKTTRNDKYLRIKIKGKRYQAHQLAFLYMTGSFVEKVDHKDRDTFNNKWNNLREASTSQNAANKISKNKFKGIKLRKDHFRNKPWEAFITKDYKRYHIGYYSTQEEAAKAYDNKAIELFGEYAKTNF